jgi:hypothetical protein
MHHRKAAGCVAARLAPPRTAVGAPCCCPLPDPCLAAAAAFPDCNVVASWGRGEDGQLGHGDAEQCVTPKAIAALVDQDIDSICCGAEYTVAVSRKHQRVYSWGW